MNMLSKNIRSSSFIPMRSKKSTQYKTLNPTKTSDSNNEEAIWKEYLSPLGLLLTSVISTVVLIRLEKGLKISGPLSETIANSRATTQFIVAIISNCLGAIHVGILCQLINRATRLILRRRPTSLDALVFWNALTTPKLNWELPFGYSAYLSVFYFASLWSSSLWTGTLTPVSTFYYWKQSVPLNLPIYTNSSSEFWSQSILWPVNSSAKASLTNENGIFTYLPLQDRLGYLLTDGSAASSVDWRPARHTKNDNSNFTYIGRSYGVGSSVGLTDDATTKKTGTISYNYTEVGYQANVECIHNASSQFGLILVQNGTADPLWAVPYVYLGTGAGPNTTLPKAEDCANRNWSKCGGVPTLGDFGSDDIVAAAWWASFESGLAEKGLPKSTNYEGRTRPVDSLAYTAITAGKNNQNLNKAQCSIKMLPALFSVAVNLLERTIHVQLVSNTSQTDIEPSGFVADSASSILGVMAGVETTLHTSMMGTMLQRNIDNVGLQQNSTNQTDYTLQGVAETLEALIDDYLVAIGSAQLVIAQDTSPIMPTVTSTALDIGQRAYALTTCIINALICLLYIGEAIRTRWWDKLPKFDYTNIKAVVVASSLGGCEIGDQVQAQNKLWADYDHVAGGVKVILSNDLGTVLRLANDDDRELTPIVRPVSVGS